MFVLEERGVTYRSEIILIVAMGLNRVIGCEGELPWTLKSDLRHFRKLTTGHTVVMGRKTYESIGKPLEGRRNIVMTHDPLYQREGVETVTGFATLMAAIAKDRNKVFVIGGGNFYRQAILLADKIIVTEVKASVYGDVYFPEIDKKCFKEISRIKDIQEEGDDYAYDIVEYDYIDPRKS